MQLLITIPKSETYGTPEGLIEDIRELIQEDAGYDDATVELFDPTKVPSETA